VLYRLQVVLLTVGSEGLVRANKHFSAWLGGEHSMPFGPNHEHVPVRPVDFDDPRRNHYVVTAQFTFRAGGERRMDVVLRYGAGLSPAGSWSSGRSLSTCCRLVLYSRKASRPRSVSRIMEWGFLPRNSFSMAM
jgi:hypothetical protein